MPVDFPRTERPCSPWQFESRLGRPAGCSRPSEAIGFRDGVQLVSIVFREGMKSLGEWFKAKTRPSESRDLKNSSIRLVSSESSIFSSRKDSSSPLFGPDSPSSRSLRSSAFLRFSRSEPFLD